MTDTQAGEPMIQLSELRRLWKDARTCEAYNILPHNHYFRSLVQEEIQGRTIATLRARIAEMEAIITYIDEHAPRADDTCAEPGITLSEAARRAIADTEATNERTG
jgi:hypothetical protein